MAFNATATAEAVKPDAPTTVPPLAPVNDPDTGKPNIITEAGVTLAVCGRYPDKPAEFVLARFRPAKAASADYRPAVGKPGDANYRPERGKPGKPEGWTVTGRLADMGRAIKRGLIA
jgi:hypothetical protein